MKVLKSGESKTWKGTVTCNASAEELRHVGCKAELEITQDDLFWVNKKEYDQRDGEYTTAILAVTCPECGFKTKVTKVPAFVQQWVGKIKDNT